MGGPSLRGCFALCLLALLHKEGSATREVVVDEENAMTKYLLPRVTVPISYEIKLVPEIVENNFTFHGVSNITVMINEATHNVTLHSKNLRIDENYTSLVDVDGLVLEPTGHAYDNGTNFLVMNFDRSIDPGKYTLGLKYSGNMSNVPEGIYNSSYINKKGEKVWLTATKFAQLHARRAFPCWDEPDLKATFNLSVKHFTNYTVVSNMPVKNKYLDTDGKQWTNFHVTPIMSPYLVAFVVSDFDCLRDENETFNVCGRKDVLPYLKHSRDVSKRAIELLEEFMDYEYNLPKMDQFAIPDATTGATENWGLIIYRESSFAYEPFVHSISGKEYVTLTVVHELAHQWIGNLVTPKIWRYSWIKEGLATFLQYYIVDKLFPDWREMDMFITQVIQKKAFLSDNVNSYKPLEWDSFDPSNIKSRFTPQIYNRGAAIFYMMSNILTEATFKAGIVLFVKQNKFNSVTSDELWSALQSAYDDNNKESNDSLSIKEIMRAWVEQQGYPLLNVTRNYETGEIVITQEGNLEEYRSYRWWVPISFATATNPNFETTSPTHWLKPDEDSLVIDGVSKDDWVIVNIQQSGYYRVNYDTTNWKRIADYMKSDNYEKIHVRNRAQLINDLSYMVGLNRENDTTFLELASYLVREENYQPWVRVFPAISRLRDTMYDQEVDKELKKFVLGLMEKVLKKIGFEDRSKAEWMTKYKSNYENLDSKTKEFVPTEKALEKIYKGEDFLTQRFRAKFLSFACSLDHKPCKDSAKAQLLANIKNATENPISPNLASWVNCYGAEGSEEELLNNIQGSDTKYVGYLGCSPNKQVLRKYVEKVLAGEWNASAPQARIAIGYLAAGGRKNYDYALDYFIENFDSIYNYFEKLSPHRALAILNDLLLQASTLDELKKLSDLIEREQNRIPAWIKDNIPMQMKMIEWSQKNAPILGEWLRDQSPSDSTSA